MSKRIHKLIQRIYIKEDRAILLICIGIALVFWLLVKLSQTYSARKEILINTLINDDVAFVKEPPQDMEATIRGTGWDLMIEFFNKPKTKLSYDLTNEEYLSLTGIQLRNDIKNSLYSDALKVDEVNYENLNLLLEEKLTITIPVKTIDSLSFVDEYHLAEPIRVIPDSIVISGPFSMVEQYKYWPTIPIVEQKLNNEISRKVKLQKAPPEVFLSVSEVEIRIKPEPFTEKSMYVPIEVKNAPDSLRIFPDKVTVTCKLGLSKYDSVSYRDFVAEVDLQDISPNSSTFTVPIVITHAPDYVHGIFHNPKSAKFFFVEKE